MTVLYVILAILMFGFLIFIHELGHFLVARACGVDILEFSIGFGPKIFSKKSKRSGTAYSLRLLPLGGFVSMLGENGMEVVQGSSEGEVTANTSDTPITPDATEPESQADAPTTAIDPARAEHAYCNKNVWQRILISIAGPLMNIVLGFLLMFFMVIAQGHPSVGTTIVASFHVEYTAEESYAGLQKGDYLVSLEEINDQNPEDNRVSSLYDLIQKVNDAGGNYSATLTVQRWNADKTDVEEVRLENVLLTTELLQSSFRASLSQGDGSNGLMLNDQIVKVNSTPVHTYAELSYELMNQGYKPLRLTVIRNGEKIVLKDIQLPQFTNSGATFGEQDFKVYREENFSFLTVLKHSFFRSTSTVKMVYDSMFGLFSGRYGVEAVSGPVGITKMVSEAAQTGWLNVFYFMIVISINLGVMNLLPIPGLDGGHILIYLIEVIRRKPMKKELEGVINFIGLILLLTLAVVITFKDVFSLL